MFTIKRGLCTNKGDNTKFIFARIMPLFGLKILVKFLFFNTPNNAKHISLELINSNLTRGHTFKIKCSYSRALAPTCGALVLFHFTI